MRCTQPGCPGSIVDGYCDVCGMPGDQSGGTAVAPPAPVAPRREGPCRQPGCDGQVIDGYCDTCGAPRDAEPLREAPPAPEPEPSAPTSQKLGSIAMGTARRGSAQRRRGGGARLRSSRLGLGLTHVPAVDPRDPATALMDDPHVPESKRNCPNCGAAVGRTRDGQPGRTSGFCPQCRQPYSFDPQLGAGDLVAGQYEVQGCLAHGGMGWIYLARDKNVSDRWVVLKGLLNSADEDLVAAAIAEQEFLAQVQHPLLVEIYNFVTHEGAGYIVMEYVGGVSLKEILKARREANGGAHDPLPVSHALAYLIEALPALTYLHDEHLLYCDFKPDNIIQVGDAIKIIDLGGVRQVDDDESPIFGTVGYQAPEVATTGPSVASDLYTIGRTLLVLCAEFRGYQSTYKFSLPSPQDMPVLARHDSLYRLLLKCCAPDPNDRFASADELRNQMVGLLREVVGAEQPGSAQTSSPSLLFGPPTTAGDAVDWHELPRLLPDRSDPMHSWVAQVNIDDPIERLGALERAPQVTAHVRLERARTALDADRPQVLADEVQQLLADDPWDWRAVWMAGLAALARGDWEQAQASFNAVYGQVPGELAPKLALAIACERGSEPDVAETLYAVCASTDAAYVTPASFGLARIRAARGDLAGTLGALDMVPPTSRGYGESRRMRAQHLVTLGQGLADLGVAMSSVNQARLDPETRGRYATSIYAEALALVRTHGPQTSIRIGDVPAEAKGLRDALERAYRDLAREVADPSERHALIDQANQTRRWSLL